METAQLVELIAEEVQNSKGQDLKILDLANRTSYTDFFVIASGTSQRHTQGMADRVNLRLKKEFKILPLSMEGYNGGEWILLDYGSVVLHLFQEEARQFYALDELWRDVEAVRLGSKKVRPKTATKTSKPKSAAAKKPKAPKSKKTLKK